MPPHANKDNTMTTLDLFEPVAAGTERPVVLSGLRRLWASFNRRREERRALYELSYMDARLLRDMGIEPLDLYDALNGRGRSVLFNPLRRSPKE